MERSPSWGCFVSINKIKLNKTRSPKIKPLGLFLFCARLTQLGECNPYKVDVVGSIPTSCTIVVDSSMISEDTSLSRM